MRNNFKTPLYHYINSGIKNGVNSRTILKYKNHLDDVLADCCLKPLKSNNIFIRGANSILMTMNLKSDTKKLQALVSEVLNPYLSCCGINQII